MRLWCYVGEFGGVGGLRLLLVWFGVQFWEWFGCLDRLECGGIRYDGVQG